MDKGFLIYHNLDRGISSDPVEVISHRKEYSVFGACGDGRLDELHFDRNPRIRNMCFHLGNGLWLYLGGHILPCTRNGILEWLRCRKCKHVV